MILAISIAVALLTAALFFPDFFEDWSDFLHGLFNPSPQQEPFPSLNDPENAQEEGFDRLRLIIYLALVLGSGGVTFAIFKACFGQIN